MYELLQPRGTSVSETKAVAETVYIVHDVRNADLLESGHYLQYSRRDKTDNHSEHARVSCSKQVNLGSLSPFKMVQSRDSRVWKPLKIAGVEVRHRIGMPGLSRFRASDNHTATVMMKEYYGQRSQIPGTLIITEAGLISPGGGGYPNAPGIWREEQVQAWKTITDQVHRNGSFIICQLFFVGRAAVPEIAQKEGIEIVSASAIPHEEGAPIPRALSIDEIKQIVRDFAVAAKNAVRAGFDGVELHGANGYLIDTFLQDVSNTRSDEYGGSIENRSRFAYEVMKAVSDAIGPERVGLRLSPWSTFQGMRMADPIPQFCDVLSKAKEIGLGYVHLIEPRVSNNVDLDLEHPVDETLDFAINLWDGPILLAGGYKPDNVQRTFDEVYPNKDIMVMFGRYFVANPDLVFRIKKGIPLNTYDRSTFYAPKNPVGYLDYPFSNEFLESAKA